MKTLFTAISMCIAIALHAQSSAQAQEYPASQQSLYDTITALDKVVFDAYNTCNANLFKSYFNDDVEFYHDKGGITQGSSSLTESVKQNLCSTPGRSITREAVKATFKVYPMDNYGAIHTGYHLFFETIDGVKKFTGKAQFIHLWQFKNGTWKIAKVLSYDHQPAE